jgi:hypothetical protein
MGIQTDEEAQSMNLHSKVVKMVREIPWGINHLKRTSITSILFHSIGYLRGLYLLTRFEKDLHKAPQINLRTLREIIKINSEAEFGRKYGFSGLALDRDDAAYKAAVPLHTYADFEPAIERMQKGEPNVLCAEPVEFFSVSSGTTGLGKTIPTTKRLRNTLARAYVDLTNAVAATRIPGAAAPFRGLYMGSAATRIQYTEAGLPMGQASSETLFRVRRIVPLLWSSPWPVFLVTDTASQWYLHALFALREQNLKYLRGTFAGHLRGWLALIFEHQAELISDIAAGTLKEDLQLTAEARADLAARLKPDPERAAALQKAFAEGEAFVSRVWPAISYASTVITGSFATYLPSLKKYLANLPIYTTVYGASETPIALNIEVDHPEQYVLLVGLAHFEFIPLEAIEEAQPETCRPDELTVGHYYETVITNWAGLYRYRLGDIVQATGYHQRAPILSFSHRVGTLLDLATEKVSESQVLLALQEALHHQNQNQTDHASILIDYTTYPRINQAPPYYEFYLEFNGEMVDPASLATHIDESLCKANAIYARLRKGNVIIGPPVVHCLAPGSFEALTKAREEDAPHIGRNQLKTPRVLKNDRWLAFLEERVIS